LKTSFEKRSQGYYTGQFLQRIFVEKTLRLVIAIVKLLNSLAARRMVWHSFHFWQIRLQQRG